jgi:hypothetical protein
MGIGSPWCRPVARWRRRLPASGGKPHGAVDRLTTGLCCGSRPFRVRDRARQEDGQATGVSAIGIAARALVFGQGRSWAGLRWTARAGLSRQDFDPDHDAGLAIRALQQRYPSEALVAVAVVRWRAAGLWCGHHQQLPTCLQLGLAMTVGQQTVVVRWNPDGRTCGRKRRMNSSAGSRMTFCRDPCR